MEKTLIIFKPDCMEKRHVGNVLDRFEKAGFSIVGCKMTQLNPKILREHYAHVAQLPFYPDIEKFMSSRPVIVMALEGTAVVRRVRDLLGPTDSRKAPKGTIRGDFGTEMMTQRGPRLRQRRKRQDRARPLLRAVRDLQRLAAGPARCWVPARAGW